MNIAGHDADLALAWLNNSRAVRANKPCLILRQHDGLDFDHIKSRNALGDANNEVDFSLNGLKNRVSSERRRHIDYTCLSSGFFLTLSN